MRQLIHSSWGDNNLVPFHLWWRETRLKYKNTSKYFVGSYLENFLFFLFPLRKKNAESFSKYYSTAISPIVSAKLYSSKKYEIVLFENGQIYLFCHISVALNITFNSVKGFQDNKICWKFKFQGALQELRGEFYFLWHSFTKHLETVWQNRSFMESLTADFVQFSSTIAKLLLLGDWALGLDPILRFS